ncbi:unnamed protein product [Haemonchus placei]|uniref:Methyltransf_11 domain-containing protein n=1 Tax=Haemonchus placei TaxID=6290 RepID=A0A0N4WH07_HAEPC|nr:unnamed protein product [Haemonchus placei]
MAEKTEFQKQLQNICISGMISASIALGSRLHLFEALASVGSAENPATPKQVAEKAGCKERYVKEWLSTMAVGKVIEVNKDEKFWIPKENVEAHCYRFSLGLGMTVTKLQDLTCGLDVQFNQFLPLLLGPYNKVCDVFKTEGPLGLTYEDFTDFYETQSSVSEAYHKNHFISDLIPALGADMPERLDKGELMCLDVGCGNGFHAALLAQTYPKSNFTGIDITLEAVHLANQQRQVSTFRLFTTPAIGLTDNGQMFDNLAFIQMNASKMDDDWTEKYDLVTVIDACHDQMRPDLCLKEIYRVLKQGGVFGMLEIKGTSNVFTDREEIGLTAALSYTCSVFHCLPVGSNSPGK